MVPVGHLDPTPPAPPCEGGEHYATFANTSATFTERADQAGMRAPTKAVPAPMARPHQTAFTGIKNFEKNEIGKLIPPKTLSTSRYVPPALASPERAPISTASPRIRASTCPGRKPSTFKTAISIRRSRTEM